MKNRNELYDDYNYGGLTFDYVFKNIQFLLRRDDNFIIEHDRPSIICRTLKGYFYYFDSKLDKKLLYNLLSNERDISNIIIAWNLMKNEAENNIKDE